MHSSSSDRNPVEELAEEFVERHRRGEQPTVKEYADRFPQWAERIHALFPALLIMEKARPEAATDRHASNVPETPGLERLGDYRILREVGRGGMGVVYEAEQESLGRHVALKVLPTHALLDPRHLQRFHREAKAVARLHHSNIVPIHGVGQHEGVHYYVMQYIQGLGLDQVLTELKRLRGSPQREPDFEMRGTTTASAKVSAIHVAQAMMSGEFCAATLPRFEEAAVRSARFAEVASSRRAAETPAPGKMDTSSGVHLPGDRGGSGMSETGAGYWRSVARVGIQVADALAYASTQGVLHRDIKPSNLLLDTHGTVWVTDFGLAKAESDQDNLTNTGDIIGTVRYMAPERFSGHADVRSDIYSLGLTLFELVTLRPAFNEDDRQKLISQVMNDDPPPPRTLDPRVPRDLETMVLKAIAREPDRRYQTPAELIDDLQRFVEDRPIRARPLGTAEKLWRWCRRNRVVAGLLAAVSLLLISGTTIAIVLAVWAMRDRDRADQNALNEAEQRRRAVAGEKTAKENEKTAMERETETKAVLGFVESKIFAAARPEGQAGGLGPKVTLREAAEAALPFVERSFANQPLIEARLRMTLATSFRYLGDAKIALEQDLAAWELYKQHRGPDHPDTLSSMHNLAITYFALGRHAEALKLREETLAIQKAKLGPDHPETLSSMNNLSISYANLGRYAEALKLDEETLALRTAKLGPDHPETLSSMHNLATSYYDLDRHAEALKLYEQTLALRRAKLSPNHPDTLKSLNSLAATFYALGRHAEALKLFEETLAIRQAKLGPDHPGTLLSMNNVAGTYYILGRHAEALKLHEETLGLLKTKLGPEHPNTLWSMHNIANSYYALGRHGEAIKLFEETLTLRQAKLGPKHPDTLTNANSLAWILATVPDLKLREPRRAVELAAKMVEVSPKSPRFAATLGTARYRAADWTEAAADLEKAISLRKPDDSNNASDAFVLAMARWKLGEKDKALAWFAKAVAWKENVKMDDTELKRFHTEAADLILPNPKQIRSAK